MKFISAWDLILVPLYLFVAFIIGRSIQNSRIDKEPIYRYYMSGLFTKLFGGLALAGVYTFYYNGGDTIEFWRDSMVLNSLMYHDFVCWGRIVLGDTDKLWYWCFDPYVTGIPYYYLYDPRSYSVARFLNLFVIISANSYYAMTLLVAWFSFGGVWRLFKVLSEEYPALAKQMAISVLFVPSVVFWGSGIMKDTITFTAACWFTVGIHQIVLKRKAVFGSVFAVVAATYVMVSIRPYMFVALMPGVMIWVMFNQIKGIQSKVVKILIAPVVGMAAVGLIAVVMSRTSESLGEYGDVDAILNKAVATQQDLKREAYEGNSFDIGDFEPTVPGILAKLPVAIYAGLFRPHIFEAKNVVMMLSAIENLVLLLFFLRIVFTAGPLGFFNAMAREPTALFAMIFAIFFAFSVGLTTSNFGALVRYKIPCVPFLLAGLYIIRYLHQEGKKVRKAANDADGGEDTPGPDQPPTGASAHYA